ncbi:MAG: hypothetical protein JW864_17315 [Spirochaetes bacterium]|nr:hypothetical protein [Spirochaetota bacterium]
MKNTLNKKIRSLAAGCFLITTITALHADKPIYKAIKRIEVDSKENIYAFKLEKFDKEGRLISITREKEKTLHETYYDYSQKNIIRFKFFENGKLVYSSTEHLTPEKKIKKRIITRKDNKITATEEYVYNTEGKLESIISKNEKGEQWRLDSFTYDTKGNMIQRRVTTPSDPQEINFTFKYDNNNNKIEERHILSYEYYRIKTYKYNEKGILNESAYSKYSAGKIRSILNTEYIYNEDGSLKEEKIKNDKDVLQYRHIYTYEKY